MEYFIEGVTGNDMEALADSLLAVLSDPSHSPFCRHIVVLPHTALRTWLCTYMVERIPDEQALLGVQYLLPSEALAELERSYGVQLPYRLPTLWSLTLQLNALLEDTPALTPAGSAASSPVRCHLRRASQAADIAGQFRTALEQGGRPLPHWADWLRRIWDESVKHGIIVESQDQGIEDAVPLIQSGQPTADVYLHAFCLEAHPPRAVELLLAWASQVPSRLYRLSPCFHFWQDLVSDRHAAFLQRLAADSTLQVQDRLEELLWNSNRLLANWGTIGRLGGELEERWGVEHEEQFRCPVSIAQHAAYCDLLPTAVEQGDQLPQLQLLDHLKADLLTLRDPATQEKISISCEDRSIRIHQTPSALRELEVLADRLLEHFDGQAIEPSDVLVLTPNPGAYVPLLPLVFDEQSALQFQIEGDYGQPVAGLSAAFSTLLSMALGRWEFPSMLRLLNCPAFQRKWNLSSEAVARVERWAEQCHVSWGLSAQQRSHCIDQEGIGQLWEQADRGSWSGVMNELLRALAVGSELPDDIPMTDADTIALLSLLLRSVRRDLEPFSNGSYRSLVEWQESLVSVLDNYFMADLLNEGELAELNAIRQLVDQIAVELPASVMHRELPYGSLHQYLQAQLNRGSGGRGFELSAPCRLASLQLGTAHPAKFVALIGLDSSSLPRRAKSGDPLSAHCDRYAMLMAMALTGERLHLSYAADSADGASVLITELLSYLDSGYEVDQCAISRSIQVQHGADSFSAVDLSVGREQTIFQPHRRVAARAAHTSLEESTLKMVALDSSDLIKRSIDVEDLTGWAKHPLRSYCRQRLGLRYQPPQVEEAGFESLGINALQRYHLLDQVRSEPVGEVLKRAERLAMIPPGLPGLAARRAIEMELTEWEKRLSDAVCVELSPGAVRPEQISLSLWRVPPIEVKVGDQQCVITGRIRDVTAEGLLVPGKIDYKAVVRMLPQLLLLTLADVPGYQCGLLGSDKTLSALQIEDPCSTLEDLVQCWHSSRPLALLPSWAEALMSARPDKLEQSIREDLEGGFARTPDPHIRLLFGNDQPSAAALIDSDRPIAMKLWGELTRQWFPKLMEAASEAI